LLALLDNPLQDIPLLTVLRSPLAGLALDELAAIRLALRSGVIGPRCGGFIGNSRPRPMP